METVLHWGTYDKQGILKICLEQKNRLAIIDSNYKTGNVDAEKAEIVTYYLCIGKAWQGIYFL